MSTKALYWILTIPYHDFVPWLPAGIQYIKGQLESGGESGYLHWQIFTVTNKQTRLKSIKRIFGESVHAEATKSNAAENYVWKEETRIAGTQFELGKRKHNRNSAKDWDDIRQKAIEGKLEEIPSDVFIRSYHALKRISVDYSRAVTREVRCRVFFGRTGSGKSHLAWSEAGLDAYPKDPLTKFWDGYQGHENVVIDEFRGIVSISHLLRWLDKYPMLVEIKGSATVLRAQNFWITSNLHPSNWYPELDSLTKDALLRRLEIIEMNERQ